MNAKLDEIRRSRESLKEQRTRLENVIDGTNAGTWEWNVQTGEVRCNARWAEIVGYSLNELAPVSIDTWIALKINPRSPCVFTRGISHIELPVRHGEGKFYGSAEDMASLFRENLVVARYADESGDAAKGRWPLNPNGSLDDVAGICDPTGRIFGLMPHPEAFQHFTNHPEWPRRTETLAREGRQITDEDGDGLLIFRNAVDFIRQEA